MDLCAVCGSRDLYFKEYNHHIVDYSVRGLYRAILPKVNFLVPSRARLLKRISDRHSSPFGGVVAVCNNCGYGVMNNPPRIDVLTDYYADQFWSERTDIRAGDDSLSIYLKDPRAICQVEFVSHELCNAQIKDMLEIGSGAARFSLLFRERVCSSLSIHVCEPVMRWDEHYRIYNINKIADFFPFKTKKKFDYIHTSHWLEHTRDLQETMEELKALFNDGGYIFVEVPNSEYPYWDINVNDVPHIQFFTVPSLVRIFEQNGFKCRKTELCGMTLQEITRLVPRRFTSDVYSSNEKGFWIRALFKKE